jgi:hypothetical protein
MSDKLTPEEYEQLGRNPADSNVVIEGSTSDEAAPATPPEGVVEDDA